MSILYVISSLLVFTFTILIKKTQEKLEIVKTTIIALVINIAYNAFICYILNLINIPINLLNLSIINFIVSIILIFIIKKNGHIQKYNISKFHIIIVLIFIIITIGIIYINFHGLERIRYISMDAREHYKVAREFSENTRFK